MVVGFPSPQDTDSEDVAWGLTTGSALWKQGERHDAIVWLKRAVDAAAQAGQTARADELNRAATDLIASLAAPPPAPITPVPERPKPPEPPRPPSNAAPRATPPKPPPPPRKGPPTPKPPAPKPPPPIGDVRPSSEIELPPPRAAMPSVTTSAPPLQELTRHARPEEPVREHAPPPPTITPDEGLLAPTARESPSESLTPKRPEAAMGRASQPPADPTEDAAIEVTDAETSEDSLGTGPASGVPVQAATSDSAVVAAPKAPFFLGVLETSGELTEELRNKLVATARIETLGPEEEVGVSGLCLIIDGVASVQATVSDAAAGTLKAGEALYVRSSIPDALSLRLVAEADPTKVAVWDVDTVGPALSYAYGLRERLTQAADRLQAIAGSSMGPLGDRLDDTLRSGVVERLEVRIFQPGEVIAGEGLPVPGMVIVGVGSVELDSGDRLGPGDFLFATEVLGAEFAPTTARAGAKGAIILFCARGVAQELLVTYPPLLELFAGM